MSLPSVEKELEDFYASVYQNLFEMLPTEARRTVRDIIAACKQKGREEGTADLPENFGDFLLLQAREGIPEALRIVEKARKEGARDEDIAEWWNLHDLQRRMVLWSEEVFRYASFKNFLAQGIDADEAMRRVRQIFPMYGDHSDITHASGDDRPLPNEVRGRVDQYREKHSAESILQRVSQHSTYNAFVRAEIRSGHL